MIQIARSAEVLLIGITLGLMAAAALKTRSVPEFRARARTLAAGFKHLPARLRAFIITFAVFFLCWNVVQVTTTGQYSYPYQNEKYPLTRFAMFTSPSNGKTVAIGKFVGYDVAGTRHEINPAREFPALAHVGLSTRTGRFITLLQSNVTERQRAEAELIIWGKALRRHFRERHALPLNRIEFVKVIHSTRVGDSARLIEETVLWSSEETAP
jgi:hypothetical protein